ncbi:MAG: hypothetical protein HQL73_03180 [Magnetococcales bacterium]|nr:hypothetical protein [Magnetococcales bacterium]
MKPQSNKRILSVIGLACLLTLTATGCGGGGSGGSSSGAATASTPAPVLVGQFSDGPTTGLTYRTSSNNTGTTDASGQFTYVDGETITFYLGSLPLGSTVAKGVVTPMDIINGGHLNQDEVVNLSRFLQTLDSDGNPDNGITISAQAKTAAAAHFPAGGSYANFFKTNGFGDGFAQDSLGTGESIATKGLEGFFKDAGLFRYKKSNWVESSDIAGYLVPKSFAVNHLRGTVQKQTESWSMTLSTTTSPSMSLLSTTTTSTQNSDISTPGTAALNIYYPSSTSSTASTNSSSSFQYYDPSKSPLMDGTISFPGVTIMTTPSTSSTTTSSTSTSTAASSSTQPVAVKGTVAVSFAGAAVTMINKTVSNGQNLGQINIELLNSSTSTSTTASSSSGTGNTATFTPNTDTTTTVSVPSSGISSLVMKATVNLDTGDISDSSFAIKFASSTWQNDLKLANVFGTWSRGSDSGNMIFNELYRGLMAKSTQKTWELFGVGYTAQEMVAELSGVKGAYTQLGSDQTNLKLITDSNTWSDKNNPISLSGYVGFQIMIYDPAVLVDKLVMSTASEGYINVADTSMHQMAGGGNRYFNLSSSNMTSTKELATILSKDLSEDPAATTTTTSSTTTTTAGKTSTKTWNIADATAGPGMISVVLTKNATTQSAGFTFESALTSNDTLIMKLVK